VIKLDSETTGAKQPGSHEAGNEFGTRERILDASRDLFGDKGFDAVSIREIAEAAGANSALIYYYFQDKDDLYRQVMESVFSRLLRQVQEITGRGGDDPEALLRELAKMYAHFLSENPSFVKIMYYELARGGPNLPVLADIIFQPCLLAVKEVIQRGMDQGAFRPLDPCLSVLSLLSMLLFYFIGRPVLRHLIGESGYSPEGLDTFIRHSMDVYFNGLLKT